MSKFKFKIAVIAVEACIKGMWSHMSTSSNNINNNNNRNRWKMQTLTLKYQGILLSLLLVWCLKSLRNRNNFRGLCHIHLLLNPHIGEIMSNSSNNDVHWKGCLSITDCVTPIRDGQSVSTVLGVLGCLRSIFPHVSAGEGREEEMRGSFGVRRCHQEAPLAVDRMIQVV